MGAVIAKTQLDELVFPSATRVVASASASVSDNCASAARIALWMYSGHGSSSSLSVSEMRFSRLVLSSLVVSLSSSLWCSGCCRCCRRRGMLIISLIIRRCARLSVASIFLLSVQDEHPYITVGVTVLSKSLMRDWSG